MIGGFAGNENTVPARAFQQEAQDGGWERRKAIAVISKFDKLALE